MLVVAVLAAVGLPGTATGVRARQDPSSARRIDETRRRSGVLSRAVRGTAAVLPAELARCPWLTPGLSPPAATQLLLAAMTPLQEATMLHLLQIGSGGLPFEGFTAAIPALCIPTIVEQDGPAGPGVGLPGATQLPDPIALGASFDPALAAAYGGVVGAEDAAKGIDMALGPTLNIDRSPLWGRSYETLGEDPYLTASLGVPEVQAVQAQRVVAVVKHFAVYNQERYRGTPLDDSIVSDRALHEIYLPAFAAVVAQADPGAMMCAYDLVNGVPSCQSQQLIQRVLHQEWGFGGFVRSDCGSVYDQAAAMAVGVSQVKCSALYDPAQIAAAVAAGRMSRAALDALARPLLDVLFRFDLLGAPRPLAPDAVVTSDAHRAVALATADEGAVLLVNRGLLPLDLAHLPSLALIGAHGATPVPAGWGAMYVTPTDPVDVLSAFRAALGDRLRYNDGADPAAAAAVAAHSAAAVVVVGLVEAERHDRANLSLPPGVDALISAVEAANPRTVVVLETGGPVTMPWLPATAALLETWYPGVMAGPSLVQLLSGQVDPSGKLPVTFPLDEQHMPAATAATFGGVGGRTLYSEGIDVGYRWYEATGVAPSFPFGFGLSYTQFRFSDLHVGASGPDLRVQAEITDVGGREGADVVQCYVGMPASTGEPPRQLRGFVRVDLRPGQRAALTLTLTPGDLATWDVAAGQWAVAAGTYRIFVGDSSDPAGLPLQASVQMPATLLGAASGPAPGPAPVVASVPTL